MSTDLRLPPGGWLETSGVRALFAVLDRDGEELRAVGGAVRNALLGREVHEIDFATTATPETVTARALAAGLKPVPTGIEHGTVTVVIEGAPYEVTTLRQDVETDGRHARVKFGRDWEADARRRDFTMNALYADAQGRVHDPLGGHVDLAAGRVRFIGDADARIREDGLRILRFFRFTAEYGAGGVDRPGLDACSRGRRGLDHLSRERVRQEVLRLLVAPSAMPVLEPMADAGLVLRVLKGVPRLAAFARLAVIERTLDLAPDPVLRLAALGVRIEEDAARLGEALRLTRREASMLEGIARLWPRMRPAVSERAMETLLYEEREAPAASAALLAWAIAGAPAADADWRAFHAKARDWRPPQSPFRGADLLAMGLRPGPEVGAALRILEHWWTEEGFPEENVVIQGALRRVVESQRKGSPPQEG